MNEKINHNGNLAWASEGNMTQCVQCGRKIGKAPKFVAVHGGGFVWSKAEGEIDRNDAGYMGWFPIGSECAKAFEDGVLYEATENLNRA